MENNYNFLKRIECFIFDMDGTIYNGNELFDGTLDLFTYFTNNKIKFYFLTNNSSNTKSAYYEKLNKFGIEIIEKQIITSGDITIDYLKKCRFENIFLVGTPALEKQFLDNGFNLIKEKGDSRIDCVVVGFDKTFNYEKGEIAVHYLRKGLPFFSTNEDLSCPIENNEFIPDCGAITSLIELSSGRKTTYIGKPRKYTYDYLINYIGTEKEKLAIVGDRLYTDIATGIYNDFTAIAVLTGELNLKDLDSSSIKPTYIFNSVKDLFNALKTK